MMKAKKRKIQSDQHTVEQLEKKLKEVQKAIEEAEKQREEAEKQKEEAEKHLLRFKFANDIDGKTINSRSSMMIAIEKANFGANMEELKKKFPRQMSSLLIIDHLQQKLE